jgi:hypothetical protein
MFETFGEDKSFIMYCSMCRWSGFKDRLMSQVKHVSDAVRALCERERERERDKEKSTKITQ